MERKIQNHLIGSDPEAFIVNGDGHIVSSINLIPGDKADPFPIGKDCFIQHDNILAEWCVPPTVDPAEFSTHIAHCIEWTEDILPEGHKIKFISSFHIDPDQLLDPGAKEFGCEPDHNSWNNGEPNERPNCDTNLRTAGGHIHIGYDNPSEDLNMEIIRVLDLFLAVPALFIDRDNLRRQLYGKAGSFRHKKYGVEYRSLSNFWVNDPSLVSWIFDQILIAIDFINCGGTITENNALLIQLAVNNGDIEIASVLMEEFAMVFPEVA